MDALIRKIKISFCLNWFPLLPSLHPHLFFAFLFLNILLCFFSFMLSTWHYPEAWENYYIYERPIQWTCLSQKLRLYEKLFFIQPSTTKKCLRLIIQMYTFKKLYMSEEKSRLERWENFYVHRTDSMCRVPLFFLLHSRRRRWMDGFMEKEKKIKFSHCACCDFPSHFVVVVFVVRRQTKCEKRSPTIFIVFFFFFFAHSLTHADNDSLLLLWRCVLSGRTRK